MTEAEATQALTTTQKSRSALTAAAGVGMALMGASLAGSSTDEAHVDHGYAAARWAAVSISAVGWIVGGIAFPFGIIPLIVLGAVLQIVAIIVNLAMNAGGKGALANDQWASAKAEARAARSAKS